MRRGHENCKLQNSAQILASPIVLERALSRLVLRMQTCHEGLAEDDLTECMHSSILWKVWDKTKGLRNRVSDFTDHILQTEKYSGTETLG